MIKPLARSVGLACVATIVMLSPGSPRAKDAAHPVCSLIYHEETVELEDARLEVVLARASLAAFEEIFELVDGLWKADAIDRMTYLRAKYDRDASRLALERADVILARQETLLEQLELICAGDDDGSELSRAYTRYLRADCDQQAKAIEVAETNLEFNRQWLASVQDLRDQVSTAQDVILAELDVAHEEQRRDDAKRRTEACRRALAQLENEVRKRPD